MIVHTHGGIAIGEHENFDTRFRQTFSKVRYK